MVDIAHSGLTASIPGGSVAGGAAHTRGAWEAKRYPEGDCWRIHFGDKGGWLGEVYIDGDDTGAASDARLIAAAPELLAVAIKSHEPYVGLDEEDIRCLYGADEADLAKALRDAIAKATGTPTPAEPTLDGYEDAASVGINQTNSIASLPPPIRGGAVMGASQTEKRSRPGSEPGCNAPGVVRVAGSKSLFCLSHKPVGRKIL